VAIEKRFSAKLDDVEIVLVCKNPKCGARIGHALKDWAPGGIPRCASCNNPPDDPGQLLALKSALRNAITAKDLPFEIRLEFTDRA
jgi:hypothetical protein